jgi:hypothetical protein
MIYTRLHHDSIVYDITEQVTGARENSRNFSENCKRAICPKIQENVDQYQADQSA